MSVSGIVFQWFILYVYFCLTDSALVCQSTKESFISQGTLSVHQIVCQSTRDSVSPPESLPIHQRTYQSTRESVFHQRVCLSTRESVSPPKSLLINGYLSARMTVCSVKGSVTLSESQLVRQNFRLSVVKSVLC